MPLLMLTTAFVHMVKFFDTPSEEPVGRPVVELKLQYNL